MSFDNKKKSQSVSFTSQAGLRAMIGRPNVESGKHVHNAKPHPDESTTYPFSHRSLHAVTGQATDQKQHQCIESQTNWHI